jgi:hypothetical protein
VSLAVRDARLADLPARPLLALLEVVPRLPESLAAVQIRPAGAEGRVLLEAVNGVVMVQIEAEGEASAPVSVPRSALGVIKRRHPDAERLVLDRLGAVGVRSFGEAATVAFSCPMAEPLPALPLVGLPESPMPVGDSLPLLLDPVALGQGLAVLTRLGIAPVEVVPLADPLVGVALRIRGAGDLELGGSVQLARMVLMEAAADGPGSA